MQANDLRNLLEQVKNGEIEIDHALQRLRTLPYENVDGFARLDHHRGMRCGFAEVVFGQGKTPAQIIAVARRLAENSPRVLVTRVAPEIAEQISGDLPGFIYAPIPRVLYCNQNPDEPGKPGVVIATGGTADLPAAEEAALTAELMGSQVIRLVDVGVAGLHRLLDQLEVLQQANVIVAAAGMEGALASVIGGLVSAPVIALPTSVGYGASFGGLAALLAMLNSCAAGVAVVNIDNGFGAGYLAATINRKAV